MEEANVDDLTFQLLANPTKLKKKIKKKDITEDDILFMKIKKNIQIW